MKLILVLTLFSSVAAFWKQQNVCREDICQPCAIIATKKLPRDGKKKQIYQFCRHLIGNPNCCRRYFGGVHTPFWKNIFKKSLYKSVVFICKINLQVSNPYFLSAKNKEKYIKFHTVGRDPFVLFSLSNFFAKLVHLTWPEMSSTSSSGLQV